MEVLKVADGEAVGLDGPLGNACRHHSRSDGKTCSPSRGASCLSGVAEERIAGAASAAPRCIERHTAAITSGGLRLERPREASSLHRSITPPAAGHEVHEGRPSGTKVPTGIGETREQQVASGAFCTAARSQAQRIEGQPQKVADKLVGALRLPAAPVKPLA